MHCATYARGGVMLAAIAGALIVQPAVAQQAVERNLPPAPQAEPSTIAAPNAVPLDQDATPIGPALRRIVVLGATQPTVSAPSDGVDLTGAPRLSGQEPAFRRFIGEPLSRKLIAEIEARIARLYRSAGHPFVSVSTPEQEISSGVLQIRLVEFQVGAKDAPGANPKTASLIENRVRTQPGDAVDTNALSEDLDWLNRYPFRRTEAVFTPGTSFGTTDLHLNTTETKPWSVYGGYANSGSPLTGFNRYFAGFQVEIPGLNDALLSYQFTGADHLGSDNDSPRPSYLSHAARILIPTASRQDIEATFSYVEADQPVQAFLLRQTTVEGTLSYRSALSNLWNALPGEIVAGIEIRHQTSRTFFGDVDVIDGTLDVFQIALTYAARENDRLGRTTGSITVHINPGTTNDTSGSEIFGGFTRGQFDDAHYAYVSADLERYTRLGSTGIALANTVIGQYSSGPLPLTEQMGLGNNSLVRGYTLDDGAFDAGIISRNELRAPTFSLGSGPWTSQVSPFVFFDAGYGKDQENGDHTTMLSAGLGLDYAFSRHFSATVDGAWALKNAGLTQSGDARAEARVTITF